MATSTDIEQPPPSAPLRQVLPSGAVLITGPSIRFRVAVIKPGFVLMTAAGGAKDPGDRVAEQALFREFELEIEQSGMLTIFADVREATRMGGDSREATAVWMRKYRPQLNPSHALVRTKLMEMGISILTMIVGGSMIKSYSRPQAFLDALRSVAPKITALPSVDR